ncbi:hypothetical protein [Streptomyces sp. SYP-A7185]|uniref:hypothetical protein n=1 Tax=Streptomyces sp. SYP-A7185 TaxID=3040076 RepID=UPI0038F7BECA
MTDRHHPFSAPLTPFASQPERWEREQRRAHLQLQAFPTRGALVRCYERTDWGWLCWNAADPVVQLPLEMGVLPHEMTSRVRWARRWITRRSPTRIALDHGGTVTAATLNAGILSLLGMICALGRGLPLSLVLPLTLLPPLLVDRLPARLDRRARRLAHVVDHPQALPLMLRLADWQAQITDSARTSQPPELACAVQLGHRFLHAVAGLAAAPGPREGVDSHLHLYEGLLAELAWQAQDARLAQQHLDDIIAAPLLSSARPAPCSGHTDVPVQALEEVTAQLRQAAAASHHAAGHLHAIDTAVRAGRTRLAPTRTGEA